jgi:hypothetical protein
MDNNKWFGAFAKNKGEIKQLSIASLQAKGVKAGVVVQTKDGAFWIARKQTNDLPYAFTLASGSTPIASDSWARIGINQTIDEATGALKPFRKIEDGTFEQIKTPLNI